MHVICKKVVAVSWCGDFILKYPDLMLQQLKGEDLKLMEVSMSLSNFY